MQQPMRLPYNNSATVIDRLYNYFLIASPLGVFCCA